MTPERLHAITTIFHAARAQPDAVRKQFVAEQCGPDLELRREVESLLIRASGTSEFPTGPGSEPASDAADLLPQDLQLGPYRIVSVVGAGGMGVVYRARDERLDRDVAIKVLLPTVARDAGRAKRFEREARATAALSHPNIVPVFDFGIQDGVAFIVSELVRGRTLRVVLQREGLATDQVVVLGAQLADGLAAAHEAGIIHRDLKPENVLLTETGVARIVDFGLAKGIGPNPGVRADDTTAGNRTVMGTLEYMAPEQLRSQPADARTDVFALGAVLYELLSGRPAFRRREPFETIEEILNRAPAPLATMPGRPMPIALVRIIERCLEKAPEARYQRAADVAGALRALEPPRPEPVQPAWWRTPAWLVAAAAVVVAAAAVAWAVWVTYRR
jgi:serine/threonine protein kinase